MAGKLPKNPSKCWPFLCGGDKACNSDTSVMNLSDTVFEFLDDSVPTTTAERIGIRGDRETEVEEREQDNDDDRVFWEKKNKLLQSTLYRTSSIESRIRDATHEALKELKMSLNYCCCGRPGTDVCRNCLMIGVCSRLRDAGFNCAVSKSKWRRSSDLQLQAGEHTFLDVIEEDTNTINPQTGLRDVIVIELNFRGEFEMAKASEEYNELIKKLPEVFVGKMHRLESSIKILCSAAKKCMKDKNMHLGPWRKKEYMKAKWLARITPTVPASVTPLADRTNTGRKPRASMLTVDLLQNSTKCSTTQGLQLFSFFK